MTGLSERVAGVAIMCVPGFSGERDANVALLQAGFEEQGVPSALAKDPGRQGILLNFRQALFRVQQALDARPEVGWAVVFSDDAVPLRGWQEELVHALDHSPAPILSLCHFSDKGERAARVGYAYTVHEHAVWGQAVAYRREVLPGLRRVADDVSAMDYQRFRKWDDGLPGVYNLLSGGKSAFTSRAIFSHLPDRSILGNVPGVWRHPACTIENTAGPGWDSRVKHSGAAVKPVLVDLAYELSAWRETRGA